MNHPEKTWRDMYILLLKDGPKDFGNPEQMQLQREMVAELKQSGHVNAQVLRDEKGQVSGFAWDGPTTEGRLLADQMMADIKKESLRYRLSQWGIAVVAWLAGVASAVLATWLAK